jgi:hypothetical protein
VCKWSRTSGSIGAARLGELMPIPPYAAECRDDNGSMSSRRRRTSTRQGLGAYRYPWVLIWAKRRLVSAAWNHALICAAVCAFPASNR